MADPSGFLKYGRHTPARRPDAAAASRLARGVHTVRRRGHPGAGRPVHGLRDPVLPQRMSVGQSDPGVERAGPAGSMGGCLRTTARHQQLPGVHRSAVPGALRGRLRARHRRRPGGDQAGRAGDRRPGDRRRRPRPPPRRVVHRLAGGGGRLRTGGTGRRAATGQGRASGDRLRTGRADRRAAPLRNPRVQDGVGGTGSPPGAVGGRRGQVHHPLRGGRRRVGVRPALAVRRDRADHRRDGAAGTRRPWSSPGWGRVGDGLPGGREQGRRGHHRHADAVGGGEAGRDHRRRRHRCRLLRHGAAPGRRVGDPVGHPQ